MRPNENERVARAAALVAPESDEPTSWAGGGEGTISAAGNLDFLGPDSLRKRWRSVIGRPVPVSLSRQLMVRILSWREQVGRLGDLDPKTRAAFATALQTENGCENPSSTGFAPRAPRPGSVLVREHGGILHRVMVLERGYAWNGRTFGSLSSVARAISGTNWNGRRFFGLDRTTPEARGGRAAEKSKDRINVGGRRRLQNGGSS